MSAAPDRAAVTIRLAWAHDGRQLRRVAELDSSPLPRRELLIAELDGEILAAVSMADARAIADPFRPTADLVELLHARAAQLRGIASSSSRGRSLPRLGRLLRALSAR